ncbi:S1C family serine protease [Lachnoclostridium phocaeense]|uniref:S1C family serine protease n=1 Tax=Lachnoclostridium phocaeense TaxID=1871021 RepID=UPI0009762A57|nr:trypsin-like peptidase domain-containing protein [Lachnoclostridium phocaeense]
MDNQYNYYNPGPDDQNIWSEQPTEEPPKKKKGGNSKKWLSIVSGGLVFGIVACAAFQAGNIIVDRVTGGEAKEVRQTSTTTQLNQTSSTVTSDVSGIVEQAMPSIVSITNMSIQEVQNFFGQTQEQESESLGSGIIIQQSDTELLIATNNHVVEGADTLTVTFVDEENVEANIKGTDPSKDLAIVAVPLESIKDSTMETIAIATLGDSNEVQVGEPAIAIGNALGYGQSVTTGIISATNRQIDMDGFDSELIQTDAAINPGNSGGALLNANGAVIGINTAKINSSVAEGMGYAIPISDASEVLTNLMNRETRERVSDEARGYLGITGQDVSSDIGEAYNMPTGVYISEVTKGSGAEQAGLSRGSIITGMEGVTIDSMETLQDQLSYYAVGETVELTVQVPASGGEYEEQTVSVTLGANPN